MDERVAILEFELRKARENISALRANLTVVTGAFPCSSVQNNEMIFQFVLLEHTKICV